MKPKLTILIIGSTVVVAILIANLGLPGEKGSVSAAQPNSARLEAPSAVAQVGPSSSVAVQNDINTLVTIIRPAVVSVTADPREVGRPLHPGMQMLDPFAGNRGWVGSGVIIDPSGYILTSRQVAGDVARARVKLFRAGQNNFVAERIATDPQSDLVLLKVPIGGGLPYLSLGDSSQVRTGDIVVAVGSPFGLAETVTMGIVSANRRDLNVEQRHFHDVIQTDASINQGNSGGPLVNINAELIGINMAIYSTDSTFSGIGFAISSNQARAFVSRAAAIRR